MTRLRIVLAPFAGDLIALLCVLGTGALFVVCVAGRVVVAVVQDVREAARRIAG